jgi:serine/threonine protein phosphatase 1
MNGGDTTLASYVIDGKKDMEKLAAHRKWMKDLPLYIEFKDTKNDKGNYLVISHSSVGKVWQWSEEKKKMQHQYVESIVMWGRSPPEFAAGIYNVFGHTPHSVQDLRIKSFYANIDTGCCFNSETHKLQGYGVLTALQFPEMTIFQQENVD